jgi:succinoglycan biosynthesis protein ExoO
MLKVPLNTPPRVSIIIANYNGAPYLEQAVRSAMRQTVEDVEILIADDLSIDDSPGIARKLEILDPRVRFLPAERNAGPAGARNRALSVARGEWIAVLDNDDVMHPSRLEHLLKGAERFGADIVADDLLLFEDEPDGKAARFLGRPETDAPFELTARRYLEQSVMYGRKPNLGFLKPVIRRTAMEDAGLGYDERLRIAEDDDLILHALSCGLRYWVLPRLTYFYRKHARSISHRSSVADLTAMVAAAEGIHRLFPQADRATRRAIDKRVAATRDALAFQHCLDAAKARSPGTALAALWARPSAARLLRLPLAGRLHRWRQGKPQTAQGKSRPGDDATRNVLFVSCQRIVGRTNGSSTYLLDLAAAVRAAGMVPHLLQPAPTVTGRRPVMRLSRDLTVFETHRVRGVLKLGRVIVSLAPRVWRDALLGTAARLCRQFGLPLPLVDRPYPHTITVPWTEADRLFVAQHGRRLADAVLIDYVFQSEAIPMLLRPGAPSAIVLHDLYAQRADSFGTALARDSVADLDAAQEAALMRRADAVVAIQAQEADWVRRHVPSVGVLTAPMAAYPVARAQPGNDLDVLFVGSNTPPNVMALEWLFAAVWPQVRSAIHGARLIVAGSVASAFAADMARHATLGIDFRGMVPDLAPLYRQAGVVISPLTVGSGLKIKLIEALAQGKAVVATSVTLQGVEQDAGPAVIHADEPADFAKGIVTLLRDRAERARRADMALHVARTAFAPAQCYGSLTRWLAQPASHEHAARHVEASH